MERLPGVKRAVVDRRTEQAQVIYNDCKQTPEKLKSAIERLGFQASVLSVGKAPRPAFYVDGLTTLDMVQNVERILKVIPGVRDVTIDPASGEVFVEYDRKIVLLPDLMGTLDQAGFKARVARTPVATFTATFRTGKWAPESRDQLNLQSLTKRLKADPNLEVEVEGHTDSVGTERANLDLSERRADTVRRFLVAKGVEPTRISAASLAARQPVADNTTREGRAKNRRVVINLFADEC